MKIRLLLLTSILLLSSCTWFNPPKYDNNEYYFFAEMEAHARFLIDECDYPDLAKKRLDTMLFRSETLQTYSYYLPHSSELYGSSKIINEQLHEIRNRYTEKPPSTIYCKLKTKVLIKEIRRVLTTAGRLE